MTNERLAELKKEAEDVLHDGLNRGTVNYHELLELVELAEAMLRSREKTREKVALLRAKKSGKPVKAAQEGRKAAKKPLQAIGQEAPPAPKMPEGVPVANTAADAQAKIAALKTLKAKLETPVVGIPAVSVGDKILLEKYEAKRAFAIPAPAPSALPSSILSVLDRVKLPSQIKFDPTAAQGKPARKK